MMMMHTPPDIQMKKLSFFDVEMQLLKPTRLLIPGPCKPGIQEAKIVFFLPAEYPQFIMSLREQSPHSNFHVLLRFCEFDSRKVQADLYPRGLTVSVNDALVLKPSETPRNPFPLPLDITKEINAKSKRISIISASWLADSVSCNYKVAASVYLVRRLTVSDLLNRVICAGVDYSCVYNPQSNQNNVIIEEDSCAPTSIKLSLNCPLSKVRMTHPCRARTCKHLQCFDAEPFLLLNEKKPTFKCPVCNDPIKFEDLRIDGFFQGLIQMLSSETVDEIRVFPNGRWQRIIKESVMQQSVTVMDTSCDLGPPSTTKSIGSPMKDNPFEQITLSDDDDDVVIIENEVPSLPKRKDLGQNQTIKVEPSDLIETNKNKSGQVKRLATSHSLSHAPNSHYGENPIPPSNSLDNATLLSNQSKTPCQNPEPKVFRVTTRRGGVSELEFLSKLLKVPVSFSSYPVQNDYLSFVTLSTNPPHLAHSYGATLEESRNSAALKLLEEFTATGLDSA